MIGRWTQAKLLGRTFFARFFESDLMPPGLPQVQLVIWSMALLASPGMFLVMMSGPKYARLVIYPHLIAPAIATDRLILIALTMIALGFAALVMWEGVFPDRRDARILSPLPIRTSTLVLARLGALAALFALCAAAAVAMPGLLFPAVTGVAVESPAPPVAMAALMASMTLGGAFVFFTLLTIQCALLSILGRRIAQRLTVVLQIVFTVALLQMALLLPTLNRRSGPALASDWMEGATRMLPPVWFLAVHELVAGSRAPQAVHLGNLAVAGTAAVVATAFLLYAISYRRLTRQAVESPPETMASSAFTAVLSVMSRLSGVSRLWARGTAVERAIGAFTLRTLSRSRQHRMLLAIYLALAMTVVMASLLPAITRGLPLSGRSGPLGSATPVLVFFTLAGMRALFAIPVEPTAAWAFRVREPVDRQAALNGVRRAMAAAGLAPFILATVIVLTPLWGLVAALQHAVFCTLMGLLLIELLLLGLHKIPFTCTYYPGRKGVRRWPVYMFGFSMYAYTVTALELAILSRPIAFALACLSIAAATVMLSHLRARDLSRLPALSFDEDDPNALFPGFNLSEGLAAARR